MDRSNRSIKLVLLERMQKRHPETDQSTAPEKRACLSSLLICEGSALSRTFSFGELWAPAGRFLLVFGAL